MAPRIVQVKTLRESAFEEVYKELNAEFKLILQKETKENNVNVDDSVDDAAKVHRTKVHQLKIMFLHKPRGPKPLTISDRNWMKT